MILSDVSSYYELLDIHPDATPLEVREAYHRIKTAYTKDSVALYSLIDTEERETTLGVIEKAYLTLSDPEKRREYDLNHGHYDAVDNPFARYDEKISPRYSSVTSIDRTPPMEEAPNSDSILIPPMTDFQTDAQSEPPALQQKAKESRPEPPRPSIPVEFPPLPPQPLSALRPPLPEIDPNLLSTIESETEWPGSLLRKIRDAHRISIEELASETKVSKTYLLAIEEENFGRLPAPVFIRGFLVQMAKILKLPHEKVATAYLARYHRARLNKE